jgi:hypothetical protein
MKKLRLDSLAVDSFATTDGIHAMRGTVAGYSAQCTIYGCPISYGGTCWITCGDSCYCETVFEC